MLYNEETVLYGSSYCFVIFAQTTYDTVMNSVQDGDIILMHEIYEQSYVAAQMLIPALLERGYRLVTVSELAAARGHTLRSGISYGRLN